MRRAATALLSIAAMLVTYVAVSTPGLAASNEVLILGGTVTGGQNSIEASEVVAKGFVPVVVDDATWTTMTQEQFSSYRAIILGDPTCGDTAPAAALSNVATWGAAINGNVVIAGTDPIYHASQGGEAMVRRAVDFSVDQANKTGAFVTLSCYYHGTAPHTAVPLLDALRPGGFTVTGVGCYDNAHIVATHPALSGLTDATISNWGCSVHEGFDTWPADFTVLAMARDFGAAFTASDGTVGTPYVLASGAGLRSFPLSMTPTGGSGAAGGVHTVTARLLDSETLAPAPGVAIKFGVILGPNTNVGGVCNTGSSCLTGADGTVAWTYQSGSQTGDDSIRAYLDRNGNGAADAGEPQTTAGMRWTAPAAANFYIALGDSYQSGEGAGADHYIDGTNTSTNRCHRSDVSYPFLLKGQSGLPNSMKSVACSGAKISNLSGGQNGERPQYDALSDATSLVTVGIGGNDVDFAETIKACALGPQFSGDLWRLNQTCHGRFEEKTTDLIKKLNTPDSRTRLTPLQAVYRTIKSKAKHARVVVVGYPHLFKPSGNLFGCSLIWRSDQKWIDAKIDQLDEVIRQNALSAGAEYAAGQDTFDEHELCGDGESYLNGIVGIGDVESFHPNVKGHQQFAKRILNDMRANSPTATLAIGPRQTRTQSVSVAVGQAFASFSTTWPGSDVEMTLVAPSGRTITRATNEGDIQHSNGPTDELYVVGTPEAGTWQVKVFGADVAPEGEEVRLTVAQRPPLNQAPVAVASAQANAAGTTVVYSAAGSYDPDGTIVNYEWDFSDGTTAAGPTVEHTYTNIGKVDLPSLIVTDNRGGLGFAAAPPVKVTYAFDGWRPPVANDRPTDTKAGDTVPLKWKLRDPLGRPVTDLKVITGYAFDTAGASFTVKFEDGQFVVLAKTPKQWANTTKTFTLKLNDDTTHTAVIRFK
ncbi:PxKF domain-containing protein [Lentzea aerocolonigenes]|uniref:PxKF domain-containing protein n=1 Tax=Lentzea aerocolonigenes TaxID=68170 RepID=UPI0009E3ADDB|nr:GDSL-type esterase/lipase family protein [Lentzea aerocolonigenes]